MEATDPAAAAAEVIRTVTTVVTVAVATVEVEVVVTAEAAVATEGKSRSFRPFIKGNVCALPRRSTSASEVSNDVALHAYPFAESKY